MIEPKVFVVTAFDPGYLPKMSHYAFLETFQQLENVKKIAFVIDDNSEVYGQLVEKYPGITFVWTDKSICTLSEQWKLCKCVQYGDFIDKVPSLTDKDYVFFIDADITIQRQFSPNEIENFLTNPDICFVSNNARGDNSLVTELSVLGMNAPQMAFEQVFPGYQKMACFNMGVIGMNRANWRKFRDIYRARYNLYSGYIKHHAGIQWFESYIIQTEGFKLYDPGSDFVKNIHSHCHELDAIQYFGLKRASDGAIMRGDTRVLFAHAHLHPRWQAYL